MRNLDAIINQLANEQQRTEHLLVEDLHAIKKEAQLFFDKQTRELQAFYEQKQKDADGYTAILAIRFDDIITKIQNGYPKDNGFGKDNGEPIPEFLTRPKVVSDEERETILKNIEEEINK